MSRSMMALASSAVPQPVQNDVAPVHFASQDSLVDDGGKMVGKRELN